MPTEITVVPDGHVTTARRFLAGGTFAHIKPADPDVLDLGILYSERLYTAAGVFTTNKVKGAPVIVSREHLADGQAQAVVVNSGCANVCTGQRGLDDARQMARLAGEKLGLAPQDVVVSSTGVIGRYLPMDKIQQGIKALALSPAGGATFARAIMTTDTVPKMIAARFSWQGEAYIVGGVAKGAGMIHPNMATMLSYLTTDAAVEASFLRRVLRQVVDDSFNMITVDGDTSTSDTVVILANGAAGGSIIDARHPVAGAFRQAVRLVCTHLAQSIARDGEGSTKLIEMRVEGAASRRDARLAARTVVGSSLVKTAVYGNDPNWGRILAAIGRSGARLAPERCRVDIGPVCVFANGQPTPFDE
ncbi:MAG: bifunctional glutamate N-acetyltransferase/amino-acid acetyltransferase ArgJ, partial [Dehalococcoidia bacterium]